MTSEEQKQILKMVEEGKINANEAMRLMKAIEDSLAQDGIEVIETGTNKNPRQYTDPRLTGISDKVKNFG
jgi:polyhydroxyalkanoate synthesis regulator phasin